MRIALLLACLATLAVPAAADPITAISTTTDNLTDASGNYSVNGAPNGSFGTGTTYSMLFHAGGSPDNRYLQSVVAGGVTFNPILASPTVVFNRVNNAGVTGNRQLIWYDAVNNAPIFNINPTRVTSMTEALVGSNIARGTDNVFDNTASNNKNNIERIDYLYASGLRPSTAAQLGFGFTILERGGNDAFKIAVVTALGAGGAPSAYGALLSFTSSNWGTGLQSTNTVVVRADSGTNFAPSAFVSGQSLAGIFVDLSDLGVSVGQTFYGYSLFGPDVNTVSHTLTNPSGFPTNTGGSGGLDLVAGGLVFSPQNADVGGFVVPEPGTIALMGGGLALFGLLAARRRRSRSRARI